jgi:hypothetical protein
LLDEIQHPVSCVTRKLERKEGIKRKPFMTDQKTSSDEKNKFLSLTLNILIIESRVWLALA